MVWRNHTFPPLSSRGQVEADAQRCIIAAGQGEEKGAQLESRETTRILKPVWIRFKQIITDIFATSGARPKPGLERAASAGRLPGTPWEPDGTWGKEGAEVGRGGGRAAARVAGLVDPPMSPGAGKAPGLPCAGQGGPAVTPGVAPSLGAGHPGANRLPVGDPQGALHTAVITAGTAILGSKAMRLVTASTATKYAGFLCCVTTV